MADYRAARAKIVWGAGAEREFSTGTTAVRSGVGTWPAGLFVFRVAGLYGAVEGPLSPEASVVTVAGDGVLVSWNPIAAAGLTGYRIWVGVTGPGSLSVYHDVGLVTSYLDTTSVSYTPGTPASRELFVGYALDNVRTGDEPRAGSSTSQAPSGVEDAWTVGLDYMISFDIRYIPRVGTLVPLATGWDGAAGVRAWLAAARDKQPFRFCPDTSLGTNILSYLVAPMTGQGELEPVDQTRKLPVTLRNALTPYEGYGT